MTPSERARQIALMAEVARRSLRAFIEQAWPYVEPTVPFCGNWHIDALCDVLEAVTRGEIKRVVVTVPPGTMKSLLVSVFWPAWMWASDAGSRVFTAAYSDHLTVRDNLRVRNLIESSWYQTHYNVRFDEDQNAKKLFKTTASGWRVASSVGGAATGEHPDYIIIDDPHTAAQARSEIELQTGLDWFDGTVSTRGVTRGAAIILIMQRLAEMDLAGHLLARGGFEHVMFPMRFDVKRADKRDPRTEEGELLWPALFTEERVRRLELDLGPWGTASQLQQTPSPEGGGLFKREWFGVVEAAPVKARRVRGWDTAATEGAGDYTVGARLAEADGIYYIEDIVRAQLSPHGVDMLMRQCAESDGIAVRVREEREGGSSGKAVVDARAKMLNGYDYKSVTLGTDKVTRAGPFRSQVEAGNVKFVRGCANMEEALRELALFPVGKHDDVPDSLSCAYNALLLEPHITYTTSITSPENVPSRWNLGSGVSENPATMHAFAE
jgi:predicted phage terminase large subunit-like protein